MPRRLELKIVTSDVRPVSAGPKRPGAINARFQHDLMFSDGTGKSYNLHFPGCIAYQTESGTIDYHYAINRFGGTPSANKDMKDLVRKAIKDNADILRTVKAPDSDQCVSDHQSEPSQPSTPATEASL